MAEMIAMLNGIPMNLNEYLTSRAQSAVVSTDYNRNLAGLGAMNPTMPQRRGWQRSGLMPGLSKSAAATFQGLPTNAMSVADQVRANAFASQYFANRLAGIPMSPAEAVKAAQAGIIASQQYSPVLAGLGADESAAPAVNVNVTGPGDTKASMSMGAKALWAVGGIAVGYAIAKMMK
jgi:hypothetical protein